MGASQPTKAIQVVVIKNPKYKVFDQEDYVQFFRSPQKILCLVYNTFDEFIEKQSLKNLHHIIIVQEHKQFFQSNEKVTENEDDLIEYMRPMDRIINQRNEGMIRTRDQVVNYIKKYSLQNINVYIYVKEFKNFILPQNQVPYVTLVSKTSQIIINHIQNQKAQNKAAIKFQRLVKDLYRKKLAVFIKLKKQKINEKSRLNRQSSFILLNKQSSSSNLDKLKQSLNAEEDVMKSIQAQLKPFEKKTDYLFVDELETLSSQLKSKYFEFMICMDKQDLLQVIEFKKKMPIQSKLIYYGKQQDFVIKKDESTQLDKVLIQKKKKQIWWVSNDMQNQIIQVLKSWWNLKSENKKFNKSTKNVIVYLTKSQNIILQKYIKEELQRQNKKELKQEVKKNKQKDKKINNKEVKQQQAQDKKQGEDKKDFASQQVGDTKKQQQAKTDDSNNNNSNKKNQKKQQLTKKMNIYVEYKIQNIYEIMKNDLFTKVIVFDTSYEEYEEIKKAIMMNLDGQPRIQFNLVEADVEAIKKKKKLKELSPLMANIMETKSKISAQLKVQYSPIESINCLNMHINDEQYFTYKTGMQVNSIGTVNGSQTFHKRNIYKIVQNYFPKITKKQTLDSTNKLNLNQQYFYQLKTPFENFCIVCSFDSYLKYLFPYLVFVPYLSFDQDELKKANESIEDVNKKKDYLLPTENVERKIQDYLNRIKVIIYEDVEIDKKQSQQKIGLKQLLRIHQNPSQAKGYIQNAIQEFLDYQLNKDSEANNQSDPFSLLFGGNFVKKNKQPKENQSEQQKQKYKKKIQKILQYVQNKIFVKNSNKSDEIGSDMQSKTRLVFPNIEFVHFKLPEIQSYINLCKYNRLSVSFFPKGSLKQFDKFVKQNYSMIESKSFVLNGNFGSASDELQKIYQKNVEQTISFKMEFIKTKKITEQKMFETFITKYTKLWKLPFDVMKNDPGNPQYSFFILESLQLLKKGMIRALKRAKNYEMLKISPYEFKSLYIDKIKGCRNLLDLQMAAVYIYSLPQGMSSVLNAIFQQNTRTILSLQIFIEFLIVLFLNFFSLKCRKLETYSTVIYTDEEQIKNLFQLMKTDEIIFNKTIVHLMSNRNDANNDQNHCVFINYNNVPYNKRSSLSAMIHVEHFSFYKQSAEYLLAPFTKLKLVKKQIYKKKYRLYFEVVQDHESNLFLKTLFEQNGITDIGIFQGLNGTYSMQQKLTTNYQANKDQQVRPNQKKKQKKTDNNKKKKLSEIQKSHTTNQTQKQTKMKSFFYEAQQIGLNEEKKYIEHSIKLNISFMKMLTCINRNLLFTAEMYLQRLVDSGESESNGSKQTSNGNKVEYVEESIEIKKLSIYQALIYAKQHQFNKAIYELDSFLETMIAEKVEDTNRWVSDQVYILRRKILNAMEQRRKLIQKIEEQSQQSDYRMRIQDQNNNLKPQQNQQSIHRNNDQTIGKIAKHRNEQQYKQKKQPPTIKWKVSFSKKNETFLMEKITTTNDLNNKKKNNKQKDQMSQNQQLNQIKQQNQHYDLYCDKIFNDKALKDQLNFVTVMNSIFAHQYQKINEDELNGEDAQKKKYSLAEEKIVKLKLNDFFQKTQKYQHHQLNIMGVFVQFRNRLLSVEKEQHRNQTESILNNILPSYLFQKFHSWAKYKYNTFRYKPNHHHDQKKQDQTQHSKQKENPSEQANEKKQKDRKISEFLLYLKTSLIEQQSSQIFSKIIEQLILESQYREREARQKQQGRVRSRNWSWIDEQATRVNKPYRMKWGVFEYQGRMIMTNTNKKWKQKLQTVKSKNKKSNKVFYREQNQLLQTTKMKKQSLLA